MPRGWWIAILVLLSLGHAVFMIEFVWSAFVGP